MVPVGGPDEVVGEEEGVAVEQEFQAAGVRDALGMDGHGVLAEVFGGHAVYLGLFLVVDVLDVGPGLVGRHAEEAAADLIVEELVASPDLYRQCQWIGRARAYRESSTYGLRSLAREGHVVLHRSSSSVLPSAYRPSIPEIEVRH